MLIWGTALNIVFIFVLIAMIATNGNEEKLKNALKIIFGSVAALVAATLIFEDEIERFIDGEPQSSSLSIPQVELSSFYFANYDNSPWAIVTVYNKGQEVLPYLDVQITREDSNQARRYRMRRFNTVGSNYAYTTNNPIGAYSSHEVGVEIGDFYSPEGQYTMQKVATE
jgi:hypothetical protein